MIVDYFRPKSIADALDYKKGQAQARFLGGGTSIRHLKEDIAVIDLQDLPLKAISETVGGYRLGAMGTLEQVFTLFAAHKDLQLALKIEASKNQRNQATLGGFLMLSDGKSPFFTCLCVLHCTVGYEDGGPKTISLDEFIEKRRQFDHLITYLDIEMPERFVFESVGRSPLDKPIVCFAKANYRGGSRVCVGGFGKTPMVIEKVPASEQEITALLKLEDDAWATAAYRSSIILSLLKRHAE